MAEPTHGKTSTAKLSSLDDHAWPPPRSGEEEWVAYERPWLHKLAGAPPTFYTTAVRPDPNRKVKVQVVALDARQLELDMAIGAEGPYPPDEKTNGKWPRFGGKLPRDAAVATRVVAAFNGAFRLDQNAHGMTIRRRTFAPPVKDVASLLMHDDGRLGFGIWGPDMKTPDDVRSLRQNLDPLLDDGEVNPRGRPRWGGIIKAANQVGQRTKRAAMCRTAGGHLLYLWGDSIEAVDLGNAMKQVGCDFGIHLDMNLLHIGFVFMSFEDAQYKVGKSEALSPTMGITDRRYVHQPNPKEFFYATLRAPFVGPDVSFQPDGHTQPPPAWLPAVLAKSEGDVLTTFVDATRVRLALTTAHGELGGDDRERVLAALDVGEAVKEASAALSIDANGRLTIAQGGALIADGKALEVPAALTIAVGLTSRGDLLVVERTGVLATPARLIESLLHAGCVRAFAPHGTGKLERAGRDEIASGGRGPRLYVLASKPLNATYRFDRTSDGALRWPKVKTPVK